MPSIEVLVHVVLMIDWKTACERSGGYADPDPWEKIPLSNGSRVTAKLAFLSREATRGPQNYELVQPMNSMFGSKIGTDLGLIHKRVKNGRRVLGDWDPTEVIARSTV